MVPDSLSMGCQVSCVGLEPGNATNLATEKNIPIFGPCLGFSNEETLRAFHGAADRVVYSPKDSEAASFKHHQNPIKRAWEMAPSVKYLLCKQENLRSGRSGARWPPSVAQTGAFWAQRERF